MKNHARAEQKKPARQSPARPDGLLDWLFNWLDTSLIQQTAGELARECHSEIWEKLGDDLGLMTPAKAREYVQEFALEAVNAEVKAIMQRHRVRAVLQPQVVSHAVEQLVELVVKDVARLRPLRRAGRRAA